MRMSKADSRLLEMVSEVQNLAKAEPREIGRWLLQRVERRASPDVLRFLPGTGPIPMRVTRDRKRDGKRPRGVK
jgi:hypothetical protein